MSVMERREKGRERGEGREREIQFGALIESLARRERMKEDVQYPG